MSAEAVEDVGERAVEKLRDRTRADPQLAPKERETTFTFAVDENTARVHTEEAALIRRLLCHDDVRVDALGVFDGDGYRTLSFDEAVAETGGDDLVVRLKGRVPLRYLVVRDTGRRNDDHAQVVSKEVFNE